MSAAEFAAAAPEIAMIVNQHDETRRGECLSEALKTVFLGSSEAVRHRDSRMGPMSFGKEAPAAEFNSPFCGNPHFQLQSRRDECHVGHPFRMTLPNGRSSIRWRRASPASPPKA